MTIKSQENWCNQRSRHLFGCGNSNTYLQWKNCFYHIVNAIEREENRLRVAKSNQLIVAIVCRNTVKSIFGLGKPPWTDGRVKLKVTHAGLTPWDRQGDWSDLLTHNFLNQSKTVIAYLYLWKILKWYLLFSIGCSNSYYENILVIKIYYWKNIVEIITETQHCRKVMI